MLSSLFLHPAFLAGGALIALPIIIHLLQRLRVRRVQWAAMEFLLDSQKKNRRRLIFQQLLLLLLRCLLVALIVLIVARPLVGESFLQMLSSGYSTDHVIMLDDSYSMGEEAAAQQVFADAKRTAEKIVGGLMGRSGVHTLTLCRLSTLDTPDLLKVRIDQSLQGKVAALLAKWQCSNLATPPSAGAAKGMEWLAENDSGARAFHLITDMRRKDWLERSELPAKLKQLSDAGVKVHLIDAATTARSNLGIEKLDARLGSVAVRVPFKVTATVHNFGTEAVRQIAVSPVVDGKPLAAEVIETIPAGKSASTSFDVVFSDVGIHEVAVHLPADSLNADNTRYLAVDMRERRQVLVVDGSKDKLDARFVSLALSPGQVRTGLDPVLRGPEGLASTPLDPYRVIFLLNVGRLEKAAIANLEQFVRKGGGLVFFVGDQVQVDAYNRTLFLEGKGIFPAKLASVRDVPPTEELVVEHLSFENHPIFKVFSGERNPFIGMVRLTKFFGLEKTGELAPNAKVIAKFKDGSPIAIESIVGDGRVVVFLTTAGPDWNNWARNPSFPVTMLELNQHLSEPISGTPAHLAGEAWIVRYDPMTYRRDALIEVPGKDKSGEQLPIQAEISGSLFEIKHASTQQPGIYRLTRTSPEGIRTMSGLAVNVDAAEGDLARITAADVAARLPGVNYRFYTAADFQADSDDSRFEPRDWLLVALIAILLCEQLLAYKLSYHWK